MGRAQRDVLAGDVSGRVDVSRLAAIGFVSHHHRGVFTPRDSNVHLHFRTGDGRASGHVDGLALPSGPGYGCRSEEISMKLNARNVGRE